MRIRIRNTDLNAVLSRFLHYIVERGIIAREIALANLLVERRQPEEGHDVRVRVAHRNLQRIATWK